MPDLLMFVEDHAQERFLSALLRRMAAEHSVPTSIRVRTARGGFAKVLRQLEDFARAVGAGCERLPDGLVVGLDANCRGYAERRRMVMDRARQLSRADSVGSVVLARSASATPSSFARYGPRIGPRLAHSSACGSICFAITSLPTESARLRDLVICAIPDPHIERWLLLDGRAFQVAVGSGCRAPDEKCEKHRYKRLLNAAVREAGVQPLLGGVEYAEDIVGAYDIQQVARRDASFGHLVGEIRSWLNRQQRGG
jgi:hypothetical protein